MLCVEFWNLRVLILFFVFGFVFVMVIVGGYIIYWMILGILLVVVFGFVVILLLIDVVVVSVLLGCVKMLKGIFCFFEGEGLMNDVFGLVVFKFVIVAVVMGVFLLV